MGIIRLEDKYKSKYKVQFTPERHYISSSSGITGSVHVFPNRSHTQKDNIDERLNLAPMAEEGSEFSGTPIRPYDSNSLEARREEIYRGEFNKFIGGPFSDALIYEYTLNVGDTDTNNLNGVYNGEFINDEIANDPNWDFYDDVSGTYQYDSGNNPPTATRTSDGVEFEYRSDDKWRNKTTQVIFNKLPENDRDRSGQNFEIALGLLLDGAHPFSEDHAWRKIGWTSSGNSSYTNAQTESDRKGYQFTGFKIFEDELGIPYQDSPISNKADVNAWPPEINKWDAEIITNYVLSGYSDLSMHPRNATKKEVLLKKANHDLFSSGSLFQRVLANRIEDLEVHDEGWWVHNNHSLCLSSYEDETSTMRHPCLGYYNGAGPYTIDWQTEQVTFEFWIKPCKEQTDVGTIVSLRDNFALCLIPDSTSEKNGVYESFKIGVYSQAQVVSGSPPSLSDVTIAAAGGGIYVTSGLLTLDTWHHVVIRYGSLFNNGLLNVYVDSVSVTGGNVDGLYNAGLSRTDGFFDTGVASSGGATLLVGGWPSITTDTQLWGDYATNQGLTGVNGDAQSLGEAVVGQKTLKSELKEVRIWSETKTEQELLANKFHSLTSTENLRFYLPLHFDPSNDTPQWKRLAFLPSNRNPQNKTEYYEEGRVVPLSESNVQYNPVQFCTNAAYIVGMPFVNVHSHLKDYANNEYPVILGHNQYNDISVSNSYPTISDKTIADNKLNYFIYHWKDLGWLRSINSMILPCDCDVFEPKFDLVGSNAHVYLDKEFLRLNGSGVGDTSNRYEIKDCYDDEIFAIQETVVRLDPSQKTFRGKAENYGTSVLVSENKLEDNDFLSPLSTVIAIPQIYYGNRVRPESVELKFTLNEDGKEITIVDFEGSLYRKDPKRSYIKSKVGHIDYGNGILCIFSPLLTSLGLENFDLKFKGEKNMHVMQLDIPCSAGVANKSQHPSFKKLKPSANANESDGSLTYISTIYLHDENLNIIGKVNLAQPMQKREEDSFIFRVKVDF